ncbi:hypothetical protein ACIRU3_19665 [Streptomyces sp. NPDC101151]|uniref:hypothetical protein n=1 Tax=Streptomyces sp. NPDC101151 TaxID=3366115 RepID=UPI0037FB95D1
MDSISDQRCRSGESARVTEDFTRPTGNVLDAVDVVIAGVTARVTPVDGADAAA